MVLGTMASRITGLVRSLLLASALGLGLMGSAFNTANNMPNTISALIVGGAISSLLFRSSCGRPGRTRTADGAP